MVWNDFEAEVASQRTRKTECHVCRLLGELPKEGKVAVENAMARREIASSSIRKALFDRVEDNMVPSIWSLNRHRRNECRDKR